MFAVVEKIKWPKIQEESTDNIIKNIRNFFKLKKENKAIKTTIIIIIIIIIITIIIIIRDISNLLELEIKDYYEPIKVNNFYSNNYVVYKGNGDGNKNCWLKNILIKLNHI